MAKTKQTPIDVYDNGYRNGFIDGVERFLWECGDCHNRYEPTVLTCPNHIWHIALLGKHDE